MIPIKKKPAMPWFQKLFYCLSFIFLIAAFIYLGTKNYNAPKRKLTDQESFTQDYGITVDNIFVYKTAKEVLEILNTGTGIIFFGFPENDWSHNYADILNESAKRFGITEIEYYNFQKDRNNNNHYYRNIVRQLSSYLPVLDTGAINLYAPTVVFVKKGEIVGFDNETSIINGDIAVTDYWTEERIQTKQIEIGVMIKKYLGDAS